MSNLTLLAYAAFPIGGKSSNLKDDAKVRRFSAHSKFFCEK